LKVAVYIEGQRLDLYKDESINITQGVQDVRDISKLFADFSQSFNVPASDRNNKIFKHYYNADIDGGFDARTRKFATIDVNTLDFKRGKIQLEEVQIKDNAPASYKITFYGDAIKIKDLIGDDKLFNLDYLSGFDHDYDSANVLLGLTDGLDFTVGGKFYDKGIVYPLISYTRQYKYDSDPLDTTSTENLVNIAYDAGRADGVTWSDLKPAIKLEAVIDAIADKYGLTFTGGFFESLDYKDAYMNLNNSINILDQGILIFDDSSGVVPNLPSGATVRDPRIDYQTRIIPKAGFENVDYKVRMTLNDDVIFEHQSFVRGEQFQRAIIRDYPEEYNVKATVITNQPFEFDADALMLLAWVQIFDTFEQIIFQNNYTNLSIAFSYNTLTQLDDIKVYDFLTSVFKMFNLVVVPDGESLLVEDLQTWYSNGKIYDITEYVDTKKLTITKGKIFKQINFKFEESEQILADQYNQNNRIYYGNLEQKLYTDSTQETLLDGDTLDVEVVFERPVYERLTDQFTSDLTNVQYCPYFDKDLKPISVNHFLMYVQSQSVLSNPIGFVNDAGGYNEIDTSIFMPSQNRSINDNNSFSLNFAANLSEYSYGAMINNIFSKYYGDYIGDIFSIKRRNYKLESILPDYLLHKLKLNDRLIINGRRYLINKLTSNIVDRKDSFELINDIYDAPLASDVLQIGFRDTTRFYSANAFTDSVQYIGDSVRLADKVDLGDGVTWVTIDNDPATTVRTITFSIDENATGSQRIMDLRIVNVDKSVSNFTIIQAE